MAQSAIVMGPEQAISFNGTVFIFTTIEADLDIKEHDTNDSSLATHDQSKTGRKRVNISGSAYTMSDTRITAGSTGVVTNVKFYPFGLSKPDYLFNIPTFNLTSHRRQGSAKDGDPCTITFAGHSTGVFTEPV